MSVSNFAHAPDAGGGGLEPIIQPIAHVIGLAARAAPVDSEFAPAPRLARLSRELLGIDYRPVIIWRNPDAPPRRRPFATGGAAVFLFVYAQAAPQPPIT